MNDERLRIAHRLPRRPAEELPETYALTDLQRRDIDLDMLRNLGRQTGNGHLPLDEVDEAAVNLDPFRLPRELDAHGDGDDPVHGDPIEIDMKKPVRDGVDQVVLDQHLGRVRTADGETDQGIGAGVRVQHPQQGAGLDTDGDRAGRGRPTPPLTVDDAGNAAGSTKPPGAVLAAFRPNLCLQRGFHDWTCWQ